MRTHILCKYIQVSNTCSQNKHLLLNIKTKLSMKDTQMFTRSKDDNIVTSLHPFAKSVRPERFIRPERITRATSHPVKLREMFVVAGLGASQRWNHLMYKRHQVE